MEIHVYVKTYVMCPWKDDEIDVCNPLKLHTQYKNHAEAPY